MEIWKEVKGYEGLYEVSNLGRVRSLGRKFPRKNGIIGARKAQLVHILVARTFIENPENKPTVNHKDGNKHNNNVNNLEWSTYSENNQHAIDKGLREKYIGALRRVINQ